MNAEWWQLMILCILLGSLFFGAFGSGGGFHQSGKNGGGGDFGGGRTFICCSVNSVENACLNTQLVSDHENSICIMASLLYRCKKFFHFF